MKRSELENSAKSTKKTLNYRLDKAVTLYTYSALIGLVIYMIASLYGGMVDIILQLPHIMSSDGFTEETFIIQKEVLHTIAFTIILIKAYMVLLSYAQTKHLNPKFMLEIAIIAPIIELVFNMSSYKERMAIFMGCFVVAITTIYLYFYNTLKQVSIDHQDVHGA